MTAEGTSIDDLGMKPQRNEDLEAEFLSRLQERLSRGAKEYGNQSFFQSTNKTHDEILAEIEDVAGWAYVLWVQMRMRLEGLALCEAGPDDSTERAGLRCHKCGCVISGGWEMEISNVGYYHSACVPNAPPV